jgi:hypothetical protein
MWASLPPVQTKQVNMCTSLEKCLEKSDWSKGGLGLGKRCIVNCLRVQFCFSDSNLKHMGDVVPSPESFKTGGAFARMAELYHQFNLLSKKINETIELVDLVFFDVLTQLHRRATAKHASLAAWTSVDSLLLEGWELLYAAGNFKSGGCVFFPQLNLHVCLLPGDFVLLRGRVLEHQIEAWEGGQRISIPHFTHTSLWRDCGLDHLVDL